MPASLHRNSHFRLLHQPVKQLIARKFDPSCGFAMSIDTEKIKVRFSQIDAGDFHSCCTLAIRGKTISSLTDVPVTISIESWL